MKGIKSKSKHLRFFKEWEVNYVPNNISFGTNISRYYYEQKTRQVDGGMGLELPTTVSKNFLWDRQFSLQWNLLKSLSFSIQTMTNARIEEPAGEVNKSLFPDAYEQWKDTVWSSVKHLGTPWNYNQTFNASYTAPLNKIPVLDYLSFSAKYNATYQWDRGVEVDESVNLGNNISNQGQWSFDGRFNFEQLYNKSKFLREINKKYSGNSRTAATKNKKPQKFERTISLKADTTVNVRHNMNSKKVVVVAKTLDGQPFVLQTKVVDANNITILTKGKDRIKVTITPGKRPTDSPWYKMAEYSLRFAMMVRNVSVRYRTTNTLSIPLFSPNAGDIFGQSTAYDVLAPGLDFAFGFTDENLNQGK